MQIHKLITTTLLTAIVLVGLNANAQFPFPTARTMSSRQS